MSLILFILNCGGLSCVVCAMCVGVFARACAACEVFVLRRGGSGCDERLF